jgi:protein TonB
MKQWEDIFKDHLEGYEIKLPDSDRDAFLNRQATRERFARRRRTYLTIAVGLPAVAAIIMALVFTISLLSKQNGTPSNDTPQAPANQEQVTSTQTQDDADIFVTLDGDDDWGLPIESAVLSQSPGEEDIYVVVEDAPQFPGGTQAMGEYLKKNQIYPDSCRKNNVQGRVLVTFIVEKNGSITKPVVVKSVNRLFDTEALRLVSEMPKWKPGKHNGETCRVKYTIPINFRLN